MTTKMIVQLLFVAMSLCSCNDENKACAEKFKSARDLAYGNPARKSTLDSALSLTNQIGQCDSIRKAVVDFKIMLLVSLQRHSDAIKFIDSLSNDDFTFNYTKGAVYKRVLGLQYNLQGDTSKRDSLNKSAVLELEKYIESSRLSEKEFKAVYLELFMFKQMYLDSTQINNEVELLKKRYPEKEPFFEFLKVQKPTDQ